MDYYPQLLEFINQSNTDNLSTSHFLKNYSDLNVRVSFGLGNKAKVPWIAFLKEGHTVQKGIYPVYLYFKSLNLLILAYGVSETNQPVNPWKVENAITLREYFIIHKHLGVNRYGNSLVFKEYKVMNLNQVEINDELNSLIEIYKGQ
jgi:5-methylcytosine-specific restriction enzyme B